MILVICEVDPDTGEVDEVSLESLALALNAQLVRNGCQKILDSPVTLLHLRLQVAQLPFTFRELRAQLRDVRGVVC